MEKKDDALLKIVRSALWKRSLADEDLSEFVFQDIQRAAIRQTVLGLFVQSLLEEHHNIKLTKQDVFNIIAYQNKIRRQNIKTNAVLEELCDLLKSHSIDFLIVKGQILAQFYPDPLMRQSGDIDFYCSEKDFERARIVISEAWNVVFHENEEGDDEQHIAFEYKDIMFEMHFCLLRFTSPKIQERFDRMIKESTPYTIKVGKTNVPTLSPVENIVFTFLHLYHHFIELGIGLRQICDMTLLLYGYRNLLCEGKEKDDLSYWLRQLGYYNAFNAFGNICVKDLGLAKSEYPFPITKHIDSYRKTILNIVFKRGNFGMYGRRNKVRSGILYYLETFYIKLNHYIRFYTLSRKENLFVLIYGIPKKIIYAIKR